MNDQPKKARKRIIFVCCAVVAVVIVASCCVFLLDIFQYNTGVVTMIAAKSNSDDELSLEISYFLPMGGYSVCEVSRDEGELAGDGMVDYDGSLGEYRIMITFGDLAPHKSIGNKNNENGIFELKNSEVLLKAKIAFPSDHGFVLYIGSDTPIHIDNINSNELNNLFGKIRIPITLGDT